MEFIIEMLAIMTEVFRCAKDHLKSGLSNSTSIFYLSLLHKRIIYTKPRPQLKSIRPKTCLGGADTGTHTATGLICHRIKLQFCHGHAFTPRTAILSPLICKPCESYYTGPSLQFPLLGRTFHDNHRRLTWTVERS